MYLQHIKSENSGDSEINTQLDQLLELSDFYATHWHELPSVPPYNIVPGTTLRPLLIHTAWAEKTVPP